MKKSLHCSVCNPCLSEKHTVWISDKYYIFVPSPILHVSLFLIFIDCTQGGAVRSTVGKMNPAVHPILYLPEYGKRPSTKPECSWACSLFNYIKSCSEFMVSNLLWVGYDSLSKALQQGHFPLWCWVQSLTKCRINVSRHINFILISVEKIAQCRWQEL